MGESTKIAWTDHTFNPWWGCQRVSPGCEHCYAETFAKRVGLTVWGPQSERRFFRDQHWAEPLKWNRKAAAEGRRARVFCASMADVFEDRVDLVEHRVRLVRLIAATPHIDWLLLTKRPENMMQLGAEAGLDPEGWLSNVWAGTTCEDQRRADERLPHLLEVPAAVRFVSYEPALGPVDFSEWIAPRSICTCGAEHDGDVTGSCPTCGVDNLITVWGEGQADRLRTGERYWPTFDERRNDGPPVDWIIVGGESGPGARPFDAAWARETVAQCKSAGVACFVKQMGSRVAGAGVKLQHAKGEDPAEWPEDLRVREWPEVSP